MTRGCAVAHDFVRDDLNNMRKQGHSILRARDKVIEILQSDNTCSAWYRTKDSDPAATFQTLTFALERDSDVYVQKTAGASGMDLLRSPYVARVLQGQGSRSTITINEYGAFFVPMASVIRDLRMGGPMHFEGIR